ncbi:hypothetical protein [Fibrisoma montanum]|uniref:hypothetical protein n=1 Tax=Fibrisoma montanum TaxID=2305895 RepID=UPI0011C23C79|nr:hypothetical protein [Fibrisoma montanum]
MTLNHLNQAIQECDNGQLPFNTGNIRSFLFDKKWYPLRAVINRAMSLANEPADLTSDRAVVQLVYLGIWTRICDVSFGNPLPIAINQNEKNQEVNSLAKVLVTLTS